MSEIVHVNGQNYQAVIRDGMIIEIRRLKPDMIGFRVVLNYFIEEILCRKLGVKSACIILR